MDRVLPTSKSLTPTSADVTVRGSHASQAGLNQGQFNSLLREAEALQGQQPGEQPEESELRSAFVGFVAETFFGQMLQAMHRAHDKPAYFHGGQAEEIFRQQLDQTIAEKLAESHGDAFAGGMFEQFAQFRESA